MASLDFALEHLRPELHAGLRAAARPCLPVALGEEHYALATVAGSLALAYDWAAAAPDAVWRRRARGGDGGRGDCGALVRHNLPLWSSKVGGFGYVPRGEPYPTNPDSGAPLALAAQVNLRELRAEAAGAELPAPYPSDGLFAIYYDTIGEDDLLDMPEGVRAPQKKYRVVYYGAAHLDAIEAELRRAAGAAAAAGGDSGGAAAAVAAAEEALARLMWTREEQYAEMERAYAPGSFFVPNYDSVPADEWAAIVEELRADLWQLPPAQQPPAAERPGWMNLRKYQQPSLWYGGLTRRECALVAVGGAAAMVPLESVEFTQQVLARALREAPALAAEAEAVEWAMDARDPKAYIVGAAGMDEGELLDVWDSRSKPARSHVGGYPSFAQEDPRPGFYTREEGGYASQSEKGYGDVRDAEGFVDADWLLFEIDEATQDFQIVDCGTLSVFIRQADMLAGAYDRAWVHWDCV